MSRRRYTAATMTFRGAAGLFATGAGFDTAGQMVQGGEYRPGQTLAAGSTALVYVPLAGRNPLQNAAVGGAAGGSLTSVTNWLYDDDDSVVQSAGLGAFFGGGGTVVGNTIKGASSSIPSQVSVPYFQTPATLTVPLPSAETLGNKAQTVISNTPSLLPSGNNEESKR